MLKSSRKYLIWLLLRTAAVVVTIVVVSVSFAWFRTNGALFVSTSQVTMQALEYESVELEGTTMHTIRGDYNGETGLGADGTRDMPYFASKRVTLTFVPKAKTSVGTNVNSYTSVRSISLSLAKNTPGRYYGDYFPTMTRVQVKQRNNEEIILLDSSNLTLGTLQTSGNVTLYAYDDRDYCFLNFAWRVAMVVYPHKKGTTGTAVPEANINYVDPADFSWTVSRNSDVDITSDAYKLIKSIYNETTEVTFDIRIYFLDSESLNLAANARTRPFAYSGYDTRYLDYTDMTYSGAQFLFDYVMGVIPSYTLIATGGGGS